MSEQFAIDFAAPPIAAAVRMGEIGMQRAAAHAERESPGFASEAYAFLVAWLHWRRIGEAFSAEQVVDEARETFISAPDSRAWGGVFQRAARSGLIRRSSAVFPRRNGHGSRTLGWERA